MRPPAVVTASAFRDYAERSDVKARSEAPGVASPPAWWWTICGALSSHQMRHGTLRPMPDLWAELLPFLRMRDEGLATRAIEEYLAYLEEPGFADIQWLALQIDEALAGVDTFDDKIAALLGRPTAVFEAGWMALLRYQTLLRLRRAVVLYGGEFSVPGRKTFWHGEPAL
jgi:hypothetical protein